MLFGTSITATVVRAIDGDTVRLTSDGREDSVRLLALDTEESNLGSNKPVTPWGHKAKEAAQQRSTETTMAGCWDISIRMDWTCKNT